eukprot:scaffold38644_cov191-Amphora_coffeaeformis.AAC.1
MRENLDMYFYHTYAFRTNRKGRGDKMLKVRYPRVHISCLSHNHGGGIQIRPTWFRTVQTVNLTRVALHIVLDVRLVMSNAKAIEMH